jgi:CheY-like chemotaxis protein
MKILIAEDTKDLNRNITLLMQHEGYETDSAFDGAEALDFIKKDSYDCIILDIMMPKVDGLTVLKEIRRRQLLTPVLLLTAKADVEDRVMGLKYRPMIADSEGTIPMYEAVPWFGGIAGQPGETEEIDDLRELFKRTGLVEDISWYFLYEASDAILRMKNCALRMDGILLNMIPEFFQLPTQLARFTKLFADQPIDKEMLILALPEETYKQLNKTSREILGRYLRHGVEIMLDGYHPDEITPEELMSQGIVKVRLAPELYMKEETANTMSRLMRMGFTVYGGKADNNDLLMWLINGGVYATSGTMTGIPVTEDEMILYSLAREQL